jgi:hypothetical protein
MKKIPNRGWKYKPDLSWILSGIFLSLVCAGISSSVARHRPEIALGTIKLSPSAGSVFWWAIFALSLGILLVLGILGVRWLRRPKWIILTPNAVIIPRSRWSSAAITIPYAGIVAVERRMARGRGFLKITHQQGESEIVGSFLEHPVFLDDLRDSLIRRMERVSPATQEALARITERVNRNGDVNDPATPRPLLTLAEFFDGNRVFGSIGCNLPSPPEPAEFYAILKRIATRPEVSDVRIEITAFDDPDWPFSDTVWIITDSEPAEVAEWFDVSVRPDSCQAGWTDGVVFESCEVPPGMKPVGCWWD